MGDELRDAGATPALPVTASARRRTPRAAWLGVGLAALWLLLELCSLRYGSSGPRPLGESVRGALAVFGLGEGLEEASQTIVRLRLWRGLVAGGVGASLALAGALLQGLFRNGLASPSVVGVTAGSVLGASLVIAAIGGFGPDLAPASGALAPVLVTGAAFLGACGAGLAVLTLANANGRLSVPTLLLAGIALNALVAGLLAALQSLTLQDYEVSRAILSWTFGTLDDRSGWQVALIFGVLAATASVIPFVARELDLFAAGEDDAARLGVDVQVTKVLALVAACLATAAAVSVAGQIAFVGLVIPHLVRMLAGRAHRAVLPLSMLAGAVFLLGCDVLQRAFLARVDLRPGVTMSLIGGPFFLVLLARERKALSTW